jgi:two-component system nitrate/nitrite response regulator NarL
VRQVLVCDAHLLAAQALAAAVQGPSSQVQVVRSPTEAREVMTDPADSVLVLSVRGRTPFEDERAVSAARAALPQTRIVCLTSADRAALHRAMARAGAQAVLHRGSPLGEVLAAVSGGASRPSTVGAVDAGDTLLRFLTDRERTTFDLMSAARTTREIAQDMGISHSTARCYVQTVLQKLGAHTRVEAVVLAGRPSWSQVEAERCG